MELWELVARERIRDTLARYNWSGDALRLDELAQTFCEDGELELGERGSVRGRTAIVELLGGAVAAATATAQASGRKADRAAQRDEHPLHRRASGRGARRLLFHGRH
jgi:hypothetical protein